jgi:hypothetical protein
MRLRFAGLAVLILAACLPTPEPLSNWSRRGSGDAVVDVSFYTGRAYTTARITHDGRGHFLVVPYDAGNNRMISLVNEVGAYNGTVKLDKRADSLEVKADGSWEIVVSE